MKSGDCFSRLFFGGLDESKRERQENNLEAEPMETLLLFCLGRDV